MKNFLFAINLSIAIDTSYAKELSNLAKSYINNAKYIDCNDRFIFKLAIFYDICFKANFLPNANMKKFFTMFKSLALNKYSLNISISGTIINSNWARYLIRKKWIKWNKTLNEIDETRLGVR